MVHTPLPHSVTPRAQVRDLSTVAASRAHTIIVMHPGFATSHEAAEAAKASTAMALASLCSADGGGHGLGDGEEGEGGWWRPMAGGSTAGRAQAASASLTLTGGAAGGRLRADHCLAVALYLSCSKQHERDAVG